MVTLDIESLRKEKENAEDEDELFYLAFTPETAERLEKLRGNVSRDMFLNLIMDDWEEAA